MLWEYFNIDTYTNKPKILFYANKKLKHKKIKKGKPIDDNFYNVMEKLENEYGCLDKIPSDNECLQTLWSYFN